MLLELEKHIFLKSIQFQNFAYIKMHLPGDSIMIVGSIFYIRYILLIHIL